MLFLTNWYHLAYALSLCCIFGTVGRELGLLNGNDLLRALPVFREKVDFLLLRRLHKHHFEPQIAHCNALEICHTDYSMKQSFVFSSSLGCCGNLDFLGSAFGCRLAHMTDNAQTLLLQKSLVAIQGIRKKAFLLYTHGKLSLLTPFDC